MISTRILHENAELQSARENVQQMCNGFRPMRLPYRSEAVCRSEVTFPAGQFVRAGGFLGLSCTLAGLGSCMDGCGMLISKCGCGPCARSSSQGPRVRVVRASAGVRGAGPWPQASRQRTRRSLTCVKRGHVWLVGAVGPGRVPVLSSVRRDWSSVDAAPLGSWTAPSGCVGPPSATARWAGAGSGVRAG